MALRRRNPRWTRDQDLVLLDYYFTSPENTHTDSHPDCQGLAALLGRTPSAVDMRLRNLKSVHQGPGLPHASNALREILNEFGRNRAQLKGLASSARRRLRRRV